MCTKPRIIAPQVFYEVTSRGVYGLNIFPDQQSKSFFLKELAITLQKYSFQCFSWSILDDHYHLLVKSSNNSISAFMQRLNSNYAKYFNRKTGRKGVVFYKRFASVIVQENNGLEQIIRYIHLNPVRCGACTLKKLDQYRWSSHRTIINGSSDNITDVKGVLGLFDQSDPLGAYLKTIRSAMENQGLITQIRDANEGKQKASKMGYWILGDKDFIFEVMEKDRCRRLRVARYVRENLTLSKLFGKMKEHICINMKSIYLHGRLNEISTFRQIFAVIGRLHFEFSCDSLAQYLKISASAVSRMISRSTRIEGLDYLTSMICIA